MNKEIRQQENNQSPFIRAIGLGLQAGPTNTTLKNTTQTNVLFLAEINCLLLEQLHVQKSSGLVPYLLYILYVHHVNPN